MKKKPETIPFKNNKGRRIKLKASLTIHDLVKMGMEEIRVLPADAPLTDGWWRSEP